MRLFRKLFKFTKIVFTSLEHMKFERYKNFKQIRPFLNSKNSLHFAGLVIVWLCVYFFYSVFFGDHSATNCSNQLKLQHVLKNGSRTNTMTISNFFHRFRIHTIRRTLKFTILFVRFDFFAVFFCRFYSNFLLVNHGETVCAL